VFVGVPGGAEGAQPQPTEVDLVPVGEPGVPELSAASCGGQHCGAVTGGQLSGAGEEVGMQVGVSGEGHPKVLLLGRRPHRTKVPVGIHDQCATIAEVDQVGAVAHTFIDQRHHRHIDRHRAPPHRTVQEVT
jgi:hypothetical protein